MKIPLPKILDWLAVVAIVAVALITFMGGNGQQTAPPPISENTAVRVEIQRYMGYETLPIRYLSLPYDLTMNTNEQLALLDVGFLLLLFVPILVLLGLGRWPHLQWTVILSCLFLLVISTSNGHITGLNFGQIDLTAAALDKYLAETSFSATPTGVIAAVFYKQFLAIYNAGAGVLSPIVGTGAAVTYPILLAVFALFFYCAAKRFSGRPLEKQGFLSLVFVYVFFWLILSSGIVWYGFLVFPLLTALVFWAVPKQGQSAGLAGKITRYGFYGMVAFSLLIGFTQRISNINLNLVKADPLVGQRIYDPAFVKYQTGDMDEAGVIEAYYPQLTTALRQMNMETKSLVYNVSTRFPFFIRENDKRVFKDNQLDFYNQLQTKYPNNQELIAKLKSAGFGYIMVDFNTATADKTPEQNLVRRFESLMTMLANNPSIEVVATNRIITETVNGKEQRKYGVFGKSVELGSYAIFRIK